MSAYPGYYSFLAVALATHALLGYTLGAILCNRPRAGLAGGLLADVDFLFPAAFGWPFVHRGITHSLLAAGLATAVVLRLRRDAATPFALGYASQLSIDVTTPKGILLLYPVVTESLHLDLGRPGHAVVPTALLWGACLTVLLAGRHDIHT